MMQDINQDTIAKANGLFETIKGLTESPREAMSILMIVHLNLWVNYRDESVNIDAMLENYVADFKHNVEMNDPTTETLQ